MPGKAVAITFDDAYQSVLDQAALPPQKRGWPYAIFVYPLTTDEGYRKHLSREDLRKLIGPVRRSAITVTAAAF